MFDFARYHSCDSFRVIEKETISTIDRITTQDDVRVDTNFRPFFTRKLAAKFNEEYPSKYAMCYASFDSISKMVQFTMLA
jgi:hypothetical protein